MRLPVRFTLGGLLFAVLCLAGSLAGYRVGYDRGYRLGYRDRLSSNVLILEQHKLADIAANDDMVRAKQIRAEILTTIHPTAWEQTGGAGSLEVQVDDHNQPFFVVRQTQAIQDDVAAYLNAIRLRDSSTDGSD
jgi:hypothetical protein